MNYLHNINVFLVHYAFALYLITLILVIFHYTAIQIKSIQFGYFRVCIFVMIWSYSPEHNSVLFILNSVHFTLSCKHLRQTAQQLFFTWLNVLSHGLCSISYWFLNLLVPWEHLVFLIFMF